MKFLLLLLLTVPLVACSPVRILNGVSPSGHYDRMTAIPYGAHPRQKLDLYLPKIRRSDTPLVVFFYGGGWKEGTRENYEFVASSLTGAGYGVVIPDYRLYPDVVFPAFVEDGAAAVAWSFANAARHGLDPSQVFLMGHSAGAHISALLALDETYLDAHDLDAGALRGLVGLSGPYDFLPIERGYLTEVFPEQTRAKSQPVNFVNDSAPPTLLIHGTEDSTVRISNSRKLADRLREKGIAVSLIEYDGIGHARVVAALAPPVDFLADTLEDSKRFIASLSRHR